jgi:hypothetical protein
MWLGRFAEIKFYYHFYYYYYYYYYHYCFFVTCAGALLATFARTFERLPFIWRRNNEEKKWALRTYKSVAMSRTCRWNWLVLLAGKVTNVFQHFCTGQFRRILQVKFGMVRLEKTLQLPLLRGKTRFLHDRHIVGLQHHIAEFHRGGCINLLRHPKQGQKHICSILTALKELFHDGIVAPFSTCMEMDSSIVRAESEDAPYMCKREREKGRYKIKARQVVRVSVRLSVRMR